MANHSTVQAACFYSGDSIIQHPGHAKALVASLDEVALSQLEQIQFDNQRYHPGY